MSTDTEDSVGVKMLADHLVQVKNQYENQISEMSNKLEMLKTERNQMERDLKKLERELDNKRLEIYNMKRANVAQHAIEERENWKAILMRQKTENKNLQEVVDSYKDQYQKLQQQVDCLENDEEFKGGLAAEEIVEVSPQPTELVQSTETTATTVNVESPPNQEDLDDEYCGLERENSKLLDELNLLRNEYDSIRNAVDDSKKSNMKVTEQFILKVDSLEHDHQERENALLASIEALKLKLDLELQKKWELLQEVQDEEAEESQRGGLISYLWG